LLHISVKKIVFFLISLILIKRRNFASFIMQSEQLASLIEFHRKQAGLSQIQLAEMAGISRTVIQDLEAAKGRITWRNLESILNVLNLRLEPVGPLVESWKQNEKESP